jgi:hypothetical protein
MACVADVECLHAQVAEAIGRAGPLVVICADHRLAAPLPRDVADAWSRAMRQNNSPHLRAGLLLDPANTMYNLQIARIVQCAGHPARRLFTEVDALCVWLGESLEVAERVALGNLFAGDEPPCSDIRAIARERPVECELEGSGPEGCCGN